VKIETVVTAVIFFSVGFLAGFIYKTQGQTAVPAQAAASASSVAAGTMGAGGSASIDPATGLPNGHPPLEVAKIIENYQQQAIQNPQDPQIPLKLANYLYDKHYFDLAIEWYERFLTLNPKDVNARTDLGTSYFYTGQPRQAVEEYKKALEVNPNHQPTMFNMIVVDLEGTHDLKSASKYWNELHRRNPNYPGLNEIKAKLDAAAGTTGAAMNP
jgi:cytochrome c-type biogenesis protein CcmH/NrfG